MDLNSALEISRAMSSQGRSVEEILSVLRQRGCSKIESIRVLVELEGIPLGEAKRIVHFSKAWEADRERDDAFHKVLEDAAEQQE